MPLLKLWNSIRGRSTTGESIEDQAAECKALPEPRGRRSLSLFGGGPHAGLCKLVRSIRASSVLEISVGDGSRAIAVLQALGKTQGDIRYLAIDPFEMAPGGLSLKQFHQTLRAENIRPKLFPGSIDRGLVQVAHTIGTVDLILIGAAAQDWQSARVQQLLSRVSHSGTVVLCRDDEAWNMIEPVTTGLRRAA